MRLYKQWVAKLASTEFADELVLLAVAFELRVRIACIPYTCPGQLDWSISSYTPAGPRCPGISYSAARERRRALHVALYYDAVARTLQRW